MGELFISRDQAETDILSCSAFLGERIKSSDGHAEAMQEVVPRYLAMGDVDLAAELSNAIDDPYSRDRLLTAVAVKCAEIDDDEYALQLAETIEDHGLQAQAMERVGLVKAGKGEFAKAGEIADLMVHPDFVYSGIAVSQAAGGDEAAADETLGRIAFPAAIVLALQQIAEAKIKAGETDAALEILARAVTSADDIEHDEERIRSLCDTGNQYLEAARPDLAIETFIAARGLAERLDNLHRDFFLVNCALGCLYAGNSDLADETLDLVSDKTQLASALLAVARESWKAGEKDAAIETLDESVAILISQSDRQIRDSRARNALHASIAAQFAGFGKTDRGVEIALENPDIAEKTAALSQIARILTVQKEDAITRQTINLIDEDSDRLLALISVSDEKEKLGEREAAISLLDEAADLSETVPQLAARSGVLNEIAVRYLGHGLHEKGRASAIENLAVIADIRDGSRRAVSLANLSDIYCEGGLEISEQEKRFLQQFVRLAES